MCVCVCITRVKPVPDIYWIILFMSSMCVFFVSKLVVFCVHNCEVRWHCSCTTSSISWRRQLKSLSQRELCNVQLTDEEAPAVIFTELGPNDVCRLGALSMLISELDRSFCILFR